MKITKNVLKQLIREELMNEVGMDPVALLKMLCASETIGVAMLQEMAEQVLKDPTNVLMVLGPYKESVEAAPFQESKKLTNSALRLLVKEGLQTWTSDDPEIDPAHESEMAARRADRERYEPGAFDFDRLPERLPYDPGSNTN